MLKKTLQYTLPLILAAVLLWYAFKGVNLGQMWQALTHASYGWLFVSAIPMSFAHLARSRRWQLLINPLGYKPAFRNTLLAVMAGYFANLILPRMGEVTRCTLMQQTEKVPLEQSIGTVLVERAFDMIMLLLITGLAFLVEYDSLSTFLVSMLGKKQAAGGTEGANGFKVILWVLGLGVIALLAFALYARKKLAQNKLVQKVKAFLMGVVSGVLGVARMQRPGEFLFHTAVIWLGYFGSLYLSFFALPSTAGLGIRPALLIFVIGSFGMVAPTQGGFGAYHVVVSSALAFLYMFSEQDAFTAALLMHTSNTLYTLISGGVCYLIILAVIARMPKAKGQPG